MRRFFKILHEIGTVGVAGAIAASIILLVSARSAAPAEYAAIRYGIYEMAKWLLLPSLTLVLCSGLIAMAIYRPFQNAGWVWVKALLGVSMLEGTLGGIIGTAREAATVSAQIAAGKADVAQLAPILRHEWGVLWVILFVSLVNIVLAVWRPKLLRRARLSTPAPSTQSVSEEQKSSL